jgi:hypothetical protein
VGHEKNGRILSGNSNYLQRRVEDQIGQRGEVVKKKSVFHICILLHYLKICRKNVLVYYLHNFLKLIIMYRKKH